MKLQFSFTLLSIVGLVSCGSIEEPTLSEIKNVKVKEMSTSLVHVEADMILHNPNAFELDLSAADLTTTVDDIAIAEIDQSYDATMPAKADFAMPVTIKMDLNKLYNENPMSAIGKGMQILSDRKLDIRFIGTIKAGKGAMKISIDVDQLEEVRF